MGVSEDIKGWSKTFCSFKVLIEIGMILTRAGMRDSTVAC